MSIRGLAGSLKTKWKGMASSANEKDDLRLSPPFKVAFVGSGNWGTTAGMLAAQNAAKHGDLFQKEVNMWVFEEEVGGRKLSEIINTDHENTKYLPGVKLPENLIAVPDLREACLDASLLVFVLPHQFLGKFLPDIREVMSKKAAAISLIKGIEFDDEGVVLVSEVIRKQLDIPVATLMGANVASEIANGDFAEATVGGPPNVASTFQKLFHTEKFHVATVRDPIAVEMCGALKNVVALGAGFCDGLGSGNNTKAAIIRIGMIEMARIIQMRTGSFPMEVLLQSAGVADLITTCYGGRNRKCAEAFVKQKKPWGEIEAEILNGQKLQGTLTCQEITRVLINKFGSFKAASEQFPLFCNIHSVAFGDADPQTMFQGLTKSEALSEQIQ